MQAYLFQVIRSNHQNSTGVKVTDLWVHVRCRSNFPIAQRFTQPPREIGSFISGSTRTSKTDWRIIAGMSSGTAGCAGLKLLKAAALHLYLHSKYRAHWKSPEASGFCWRYMPSKDGRAKAQNSPMFLQTHE